MKTEILERNNQINEQFEELKSQTGKLVTQIDKEKDYHVRRYVFLIVQHYTLYFTA